MRCVRAAAASNLALAIVSALIFASACHSDPLGSGTDARAIGTGGAGGGGGGFDAADPRWTVQTFALPREECAGLSLARSCGFVKAAYGSEGAGTFDAVPELSGCGQEIPYDGCRHLRFTFDANGCLSSTAFSKSEGDIGGLRACLTNGFSPERWPCLASKTVAFDESCLIRN